MPILQEKERGEKMSCYADLRHVAPSAEPKTEMVLCALADRTCPFQGKEYAWCLTCPHISEEDRALVKKAVAEPKTVRWVRKEKEINDCDGHRAYYWYECDNCGARPPKDQWGHEWHSDFCPNCGAKMEGGGTE